MQINYKENHATKNLPPLKSQNGEVLILNPSLFDSSFNRGIDPHSQRWVGGYELKEIWAWNQDIWKIPNNSTKTLT